MAGEAMASEQGSAQQGTALDVARHYSTAHRAGLPPHVRHRGTHLLVAAASAAVAGRSSSVTHRLRDLLGTADGHGSSPHSVAYVAAAAATRQLNEIDFEPTARAACIAAGAALGAAVAHDVTGARFLDAFTLGCEFQLRLARVVDVGEPSAGWHPGGVTGPLAASLVTSLIGGYSLEQTANALGIAASCTLGSQPNADRDLDAVLTGKSAANGLVAAMLAESGLDSSDSAIEGERGLIRTLAPGVHAWPSDWFVCAGPWLIESSSRPQPIGDAGLDDPGPTTLNSLPDRSFVDDFLRSFDLTSRGL